MTTQEARKAERIFQRECRNRIITRYHDLLLAWYKSSQFAPQGWPDFEFILKDGRHIYIEFKKYIGASHRPNQDYYIDLLRRQEGNFAAFVYPENEESTLRMLDRWVYGMEDVEVGEE